MVNWNETAWKGKRREGEEREHRLVEGASGKETQFAFLSLIRVLQHAHDINTFGKAVSTPQFISLLIQPEMLPSSIHLTTWSIQLPSECHLNPACHAKPSRRIDGSVINSSVFLHHEEWRRRKKLMNFFHHHHHHLTRLTCSLAHPLAGLPCDYLLTWLWEVNCALMKSERMKKMIE